jgi:hypothetical protein
LFYVFFFQWQHKTFFISTEALWWFLVQNKWIFYFYFMLKRILRKQDHFSNTVTIIYWNIEKAIKNLNFEDTLYALPEKLYITFVNQSALQNFQDFCSRGLTSHANLIMWHAFIPIYHKIKPIRKFLQLIIFKNT